jgi:TonB family protein
MSDLTRARVQLTGTEMRPNGSGLERVPTAPDPRDFFEVRMPHRALPVRIEYAAIRELRGQLNTGSESVGLLLGSSSRDALSIQRCELLTLSLATLGDPKSLQGALRQFIKARLQTPLEDAPELLGCFRTQIDGWPGMKEGDLEIARQNLSGSNQLFLSIRTPQHRPWLAALYALEAKNSSASGEPSSEFPFDEYLLRNGYLTDLMEASEAEDELPVRPRLLRHRTGWIVASLLFAILLAGSATAAYKYKWIRLAARPALTGQNSSVLGSLSLKVNRSGNDFEVSWDRLSPAVQQSTNGMLTISDGALTRNVALSGPQLREGRILYTPLFEELTFRLEVATPDQGAAAESVQVLAWSGKQPSDLPASVPPIAADNSKPPARARETKLSVPAPAGPVAAGSTLSNVTKSGAATPAKSAAVIAPAPKSAASNLKQPPPAKPPQPAKSSSGTETARVVPPLAPNIERSPASQNTPPASANTPPAQPPTAQAPKPGAPPAAAPSALSTSAPTAASPATVSAATPASSVFAAPVPIQRVAPTLPRNIANAAPGSPKVTAVSVRTMIDSAGSVQSAQVVSSTPKGVFGETIIQKAAVDAAKMWKFRPGQLNGKNVAAEYTIDFKFQ